MTVVYHVTCCQQDMKSKILFATTDYSFFTSPVTQALQKLGFDVEIFDYYKPNFLVRGLGTLRTNPNFINSLINQALINRAIQFKPKYLLVIKGQNILPATIRQIQQLGIITINWYPDWYDSWPWIIRHASIYNFFINTCWTTHRRLQQAGIINYYLPFAGPTLADPRPLAQIYPITFVGQYTLHRRHFLNAISDLGLKVWGDRWNGHHLPYVVSNRIPVNLTHRIIRQSQIVVNPLIGTAQNHPNHANVRTFEVTTLGSFLLTQATPILKRYFDINEELVTFSTPDNLRQKTIYFLNHPRHRLNIASSGQARALKDHTFYIRLKQLFTLVGR